MLVQNLLLTSLCLNTSACPNDYKREETQFLEKLHRDFETISNKTFNVATLNYPPMSYISGNRGGGIAFDIFHAIQNRYQFKYKLIQNEEKMVSMIDVLERFENETDLVVAIIPVTGRIERILKYSITIGSNQWHVLMKRPKLSATGSGLLQPFTWEVWILTIVTVLAVGLIFYTLAVVQSKFEQQKMNIKDFSLSSCMWFVYGAILKQGSTLNPITDSSRILFATWWIFIMVLTAFYTANLTAFLTLNTFTLPINSLRDIGKKGYTWCTPRNIVDNITNDPTDELSKSLVGSQKMVVSISDPYQVLDHNVLEENFVLVAEKPLIDVWVYNSYLKSLAAGDKAANDCPYAVTEWSFLSTSIAFAYSKSFSDIFIFNRALQRLVESGLINYWFKSMLPSTNVCPLNQKISGKRLRNSDLKLTYCIVGFGFFLSAILFCNELLTRIFEERRKKKMIINQKNNLFAISPPPPYDIFFAPPFAREPNYKVRRQEINGRDYWCVKSKRSQNVKLIPVRAPSALLFNYTKY